MSFSHQVSLNDIRSAAIRLAGKVKQTPLELSGALSNAMGTPVHLKLENLQITGSFKFRGASNAVMSLSDSEKQAGVVGVSTGNHGRGLARAAANSDVRCIIVMSKLVPANKVEAIKAEGAEVVISGTSQDEAQIEVDLLVKDGMTMLPPFDHADIIAGQGTVGLEILDALPDVETILVPVSGGGLIAGVAAAIKSQKSNARIVGITMQRGAAMHASLAAGQPVEVEELPTLADSLGGGIGLNNQYTFAMVQDLVDELVLVDEVEIAKAIRHCYWEEKQISEGSGAVGIAALLSAKIKSNGPIVALLSGSNIDMKLHHRVISGEDVDVSKEIN